MNCAGRMRQVAVQVQDVVTYFAGRRPWTNQATRWKLAPSCPHRPAGGGSRQHPHPDKRKTGCYTRHPSHRLPMKAHPIQKAMNGM